MQTTLSPDPDLLRNVSNSSSDDRFPDSFYDPIRYVKFYALSVIIPLGLVFNSVASMIFLRKRMRNIGTAHYFIGLACADNIVLIGEYLLWTSSHHSNGFILGLNFTNTQTAGCRLVHFLRYMGRLWSSWLVVVICLDRYITIALPHITLPCSSSYKKPALVVCGIALISTALSCPAFFAVGSHDFKGELRCLISQSYQDAYHRWRQVVMTMGELILPCIIVAIFTALIIIRLTRARNRLPGQHSITVVSEERAARRRSRDAQLTMALLSVATCFVILRLPYIVIYELSVDKSGMSAQKKLDLYVAYQVSYLVAVTNYAINFFLYVVSGARFRSELLQMLRCERDRCAGPISVTTQHATLGASDAPSNQQAAQPCNIPLKELGKQVSAKTPGNKQENIGVSSAAKYVSLPQAAGNDTSQQV